MSDHINHQGLEVKVDDYIDDNAGQVTMVVGFSGRNIVCRDDRNECFTYSPAEINALDHHDGWSNTWTLVK